MRNSRRGRAESSLLAQEEAQRFNHTYIGTEHILLGLVRETDGVAAKVLTNLGVELPKVRSAVEFIIGRGERASTGEIGLTPRAKKVIELAVDEARRLNHTYIGTEHLLIGLMREGEGVPRRRPRKPRSHPGQDTRRDQPHTQPERAAVPERRTRKIQLAHPHPGPARIDLTKAARDAKLDPTVGRDREIQRVTQILSRRTKNNPVLVGEPESARPPS